jgi:lauroyl/myristoyl acyltransferase
MPDLPFQDSVSYAGYLTGWSGIRWLPERSAYRMFRGIADGAYRRNGKGVSRLRSNLQRALGDADRRTREHAVHEGMRSYMRYWCDAFRLPDWRPEDIPRRVTVIGEENLTSQLATGHGVVAALPHMANWDLAGAWACRTHTTVTTVAEQLEPRRLYDRFVAFRSQLGMEILPLGGSGVMDRLVEAAREGHIVPLLADRDLTASGVEVTLLAEPVKVPAGPAVLSRRSGLPLTPVTLAYRGTEPHHLLEITFHDPVEPSTHADTDEAVRRQLQMMADVFSSGIRADPQDWHMLQRVFVADLDPSRAPSGA